MYTKLNHSKSKFSFCYSKTNTIYSIFFFPLLWIGKWAAISPLKICFRLRWNASLVRWILTFASKIKWTRIGCQYFLTWFLFLQHDALDVPSDYLENDLLVNPVTFEQIIDNVTNGTYANTDEFLLDFKWMHHNFNILAGRGGGKNFHFEIVYIPMLKTLMKFNFRRWKRSCRSEERSEAHDECMHCWNRGHSQLLWLLF